MSTADNGHAKQEVTWFVGFAETIQVSLKRVRKAKCMQISSKLFHTGTFCFGRQMVHMCRRAVEMGKLDNVFAS